jgi:hypothetical protein
MRLIRAPRRQLALDSKEPRSYFLGQVIKVFIHQEISYFSHFLHLYLEKSPANRKESKVVCRHEQEGNLRKEFSDIMASQTCPTCNGRGSFTCNNCNGSGEIVGKEGCKACNGVGWIECNNCNGTGAVDN